MKEAFQRLTLLLLTITLMMIWKSHGTRSNNVPVAFVLYTSPVSVVRLTGDIDDGGIYNFSDGESLATVIKMAAPEVPLTCTDAEFLKRLLESGDQLSIKSMANQCVEITVKRMKAKEMMLLGMPLDLKQMTVSDWVSIPGIGPGLAANIIRERQINGGFDTIDDLLRVPGIGEEFPTYG